MNNSLVSKKSHTCQEYGWVIATSNAVYSMYVSMVYVAVKMIIL